MDKYELTSETKIVFGKTLYRIKALIDFSTVKAGDLGGFIEKEANLSQAGKAWVSGNARVFGDAWENSPLQIQGTKHFFNVCAKGFIHIGCNKLSFEKWQKNYRRIGKKHGYSDEQIMEYGMYIKLAIKLYTDDKA